jgi:DNA-directed RNA polymerase subunit K
MSNHRYKTRFEKTRIISARALQISQGAPVMVKVPKGVTEPIDIAKLEWEAGVIPIEIKKEEKKD